MDSILILALLVSCVFICNINGDPIGSFTTTKIGPRPIWNSTYTDKLRHDILLNYDKFARPSQHYNVTTVQFGLTLRHIEINEFKSTITLHTWISMTWNDDKLKWNESDYGGLSFLNLGEHEIWQPDIFLYNSATATSVNQYGNSHCLSYPNGEILWVPPAQFSAICEFNLKYWPFDRQTCSLRFGSWTYHGNMIDLQLYQNRTTLEHSLIAKNTEWDIVETTAERKETYYACCLEGYPEIRVNVTLQRISPMYKAYIITPAFAIIMMTLLCFWLPPQAGEKIILNGCLALTITLYLLYFAQKIPAMATDTPLIVFFFSSSLYIICFSMLNSVLVIWLSRTQHTKSLPWLIKQPLVGFLGKWLGLGHYITEANMNFHRATAEEMRDHQVTDFEDHMTNEEHQIIRPVSKAPLQQDWILFAAAIDRISFIFYSFLFAILALSYSI